ncbi:hypothetical protein PAMP_024924 [Pampus punctatissimus]
MEVPVVKIRGGEAGAEEKMMIKSIVNMDISTPYIMTNNIQEFGDGENTDFETVFVLSDFDSPDYSYLYKHDNRIVGPPVVLHCAAREEPLPFSCRPLYSTTMLNLALCFTGFRNKDEIKGFMAPSYTVGSYETLHLHTLMCAENLHEFNINSCRRSTDAYQPQYILDSNCAPVCAHLLCRIKKNLVNLVHHMGGTIRKDFSTKVTHLIAYSTHGEKYKLAVCMGTPILTPLWIHKAWERRDDVSFHAGEEAFRTEFKVPPFQDCILSFLGFSDEEKANMEERTLKHGGRHLEVGDERCTHMVVEENSVKELPPSPSKKLFVVKQEWFWGSIQMDARAGESMYLYEKNDSPAMKKAVSLLSLTTPNSNRKRRRLRDTLAQLTKETEISPFPPPRKRPSAEHSLSIGSLLDISNTPETCKALAGGRVGNSSGREGDDTVTRNTIRRRKTRQRRSRTDRNERRKRSYLSTEVSLQQREEEPGTCAGQLFKLPLEKEGQVGGPILAQEEIKTIFGSIPDIYEVHTRIKSDLEELLTAWSEDKSVGDIILKYSKELVKAYPPFVNFFEMSKETIVRCEKQKPRFHAFLKINQAKPECGRQTLAELLIRPVQRLPSVALLLNGNSPLLSSPLFSSLLLSLHDLHPTPACLLLTKLSLSSTTADIKKHTSDDNPDKITLEKAIESLKEVMTHINEDKRKTEGQKQIFDVVYEVDGCPANLLSSHRSLVHRVETIALGDQPCDRGEQVTLFLFNDCLEEDLIHCTDPDSLQVSTKDMDSTLSKASRAIKKTSKKVTRAFSFTKTPKRVIQRAFMANSTPDEKSQRLSCENRLGSSSTLAMSRSASTFSLSDSAKSSAVVQRSNSLDHPPVRARVPVCIRTPCSPAQNPAHSPDRNTDPHNNQSLCPNYYPRATEPKSIHHAPLSTEPLKPHSSLPTPQQSTSSIRPTPASIPAAQNSTQLNSKSSQLKSGRHVSRQLLSVGLQPRAPAPYTVGVKGSTFSEARRDPQVPSDPRKAVLTSPRRETLL